MTLARCLLLPAVVLMAPYLLAIETVPSAPPTGSTQHPVSAPTSAKAESLDRLSRLQTQLHPLLADAVAALRRRIAMGPPYQLQERFARVDRLTRLLDSPDVDAADKYRQVIEAYRVELDDGRTIEAYRAILTDGETRLVDFLSVGRLALYYQTLNAKESGLWLPDGRRWRRLSKEDNERIIDGLRAARRLTPPGLVVLPLPGPRARSTPIAADVESRTDDIPTPKPELPRDLEAKLAKAPEDTEPLLLQIRESAAALQPFYKERLPAGDAPAQRALINVLSDVAHVPSADELQRLFHSLQAQIDALGSVYTTRETVYLPDGRAIEQDVLHVGGFGSLANGRYLVYSAEADKLVELTRQPDDALLAMASDYWTATRESIASVAIDPSGGQTLQLVVQVPHLEERIAQGGPVGYLILFLGLMALTLGGYRYSRLHADERGIRRQLVDREPQPDNPLGRILARLRNAPGRDAESLNLAADQALLIEQERLERSLPMLRLLAAIAPMLGLLGTVTGMIATFQAIALHGSGDPKLMSGGISEALVTTVEGLITAIPILLLHSVLVTKSGRLASMLEAQSAAAIARRLEVEGTGVPAHALDARSEQARTLRAAI